MQWKRLPQGRRKDFAPPPRKSRSDIGTARSCQQELDAHQHLQTGDETAKSDARHIGAGRAHLTRAGTTHCWRCSVQRKFAEGAGLDEEARAMNPTLSPSNVAGVRKFWGLCSVADARTDEAVADRQKSTRLMPDDAEARTAIWERRLTKLNRYQERRLVTGAPWRSIRHLANAHYRWV